METLYTVSLVVGMMVVVDAISLTIILKVPRLRNKLRSLINNFLKEENTKSFNETTNYEDNDSSNQEDSVKECFENECESSDCEQCSHNSPEEEEISDSEMIEVVDAKIAQIHRILKEASDQGHNELDKVAEKIDKIEKEIEYLYNVISYSC